MKTLFDITNQGDAHAKLAKGLHYSPVKSILNTRSYFPPRGGYTYTVVYCKPKRFGINLRQVIKRGVFFRLYLSSSSHPKFEDACWLDK